MMKKCVECGKYGDWWYEAENGGFKCDPCAYQEDPTSWEPIVEGDEE
jgi:hypothetical protein